MKEIRMNSNMINRIKWNEYAKYNDKKMLGYVATFKGVSVIEDDCVEDDKIEVVYDNGRKTAVDLNNASEEKLTHLGVVIREIKEHQCENFR